MPERAVVAGGEQLAIVRPRARDEPRRVAGDSALAQRTANDVDLADARAAEPRRSVVRVVPRAGPVGTWMRTPVIDARVNLEHAALLRFARARCVRGCGSGVAAVVFRAQLRRRVARGGGLEDVQVDGDRVLCL